MLTKITVRNFKRFGEAEIELGNPVVFIGPNNSGKTSALQALALWDVGLKRWNERRSGKKTPEKRPGVTVNRRDLVSLPMPNANLKGVALFDRLDGGLPDIGSIQCLMWEQCEIENYLCSQATLEAYAFKSAEDDVPGPLFIRAEAATRLEAMREAIEEITSALEKLGRGSP